MVISEIKKASELGYKSSGKYIWHACIDCGKERWVILEFGQPKNLRCYPCSRRQENHWHWSGGQIIKLGYVMIKNPSHPRANNRGYVKRAVLILEELLGRYLLSSEVSHHINGIRDDDRPENLRALLNSEHAKLPKKKKASDDG